MSQSRDLQRHIGQLSEIRTILNSMKNMAFMEIHKLANFQNRQSLAVANIEQAAQDLLNFFPRLAFTEDSLKHVFILLGSERGFCGDFNESIILALSEQDYDGLITIGGRLANRLNEDNAQVISSIPGANAAEEISAIIHQLIQAINKNAEKVNNANNEAFDIRLTILYHGDVSSPVIQRQILPPFPLAGQAKTLPRGEPPLLNLEPSQFFSELIHHYLFAVLNEVFYTSLIAENQSRLQHLESAVTHLDKETIDLQSKLQMHRQEEITEEIEIILLNAEINQSF